ncbi:uncharacterized protein LOC144912820 [Branchiostoma floridae x Branchiostoma belcheri]
MPVMFSPFYPSRPCCRTVRPRGFPGVANDVPLYVIEHQIDAALQDGLLFLNQLLSPSQCPCRPPTQKNKAAEKKPDEGTETETKTEATPEKYQVSLDVTGFSPDEISVKTVGNKVRVHGKHEARHADQNGHSFRYQELRREFVLPEGVDPETVTSVLSKEGVLSIQAPRMAIEAPPAEKVVPVQSAEAPAVENGKEDTGSAEGDDEMAERWRVYQTLPNDGNISISFPAITTTATRPTPDRTMALVFSPFYPSRPCCRTVRPRPRGFPGVANDVPLYTMEHQIDAALQDGLLFLNQLLSPSQCPCRPPTQQNKAAEKKPDEGTETEIKTEATPEKYQVSLDVTGFSPDEISVKTVGNKVRVHGKHEARHADQNGHSFRYQELRREFVLPEGVDPETVTSVLSKEGVLSIQAPRMAIEAPPAEKVVPVQSAEAPAVENGKEDTGSAEGDDEMAE